MKIPCSSPPGMAGPFQARCLSRLRMVEDGGADTGFRVHHEGLGEADADLFGVQEAEYVS